ncbi:alcohol dehydrogenase catalytic domain-containing protein [Aeromicrobium tamlense]|uniref:Alcohol dehydrogenase n=1 Tax=Aeromicrobium tamlense TaxID=375541 RepID=A0A8I0FUJ1_9ACTN|nr:alcohol dehydrogenase catalytic domain-containing protein [Aeromicrobium tamlense]MBD1269953.1 alcohol dehydrogenase catalytic domain-containing protein [Aeromicrobium tamlense]NYI39390.1 alcohol dehydrogenase [Aeromicrobium tamlense]
MKIRGAVLESIGAPSPFDQSRPLQVAELDLAEPGPTEVLVRVEAAGVCHSDLSVVDGKRPRPVPMLLGHEAAGRIEQVGAEVTDLAVGQRVIMTFLPRCGECAGCATDGMAPCVPGSVANGGGELLAGGSRLSRDGSPVTHHLGVSGFATHAVVDHRSLVPVEDDVPPNVAAVLGCAVLTGGGAVINVAKPRSGQTVAVVGLGGVGLAAALTALSYEGVRVVGIDPLGHKRAAALQAGVHEALTPDEAAEKGFKADAVIEAVGSGRVFASAIALTAPGGKTITVGLPAPDDTIELSPLALVAEGKTLVGSYLGSAVPKRDIPVFVDMWRAGQLPLEHLVSSTIALDDINRAMDDLADGSELRQIIDFTQE